jgi:hypothetical protein
MALGSGASRSEAGSSGSTPKQGTKRTLGELIDGVAKFLVLVLGLPIRFAAAIVSQFVSNGGSGRAVVGGALFLIGAAVSTDSVWQTLFGQPPLFPWFEPQWSWVNVPRAVFNPFFYAAFLIAVGVQVLQAYSMRGKNPDSARRELQDHMQYDLEQKPSGKIDLVGEIWKDYKTAGLRDRSSVGFVALFVWGFDIVSTFAARNPWQYTDPLVIVGCILFNLATMLAGEIGYTIWRLTKD